MERKYIDTRNDHAVETDEYDAKDWEIVRFDIGVLAQAEKRIHNDFDFVDKLFGDVFQTLYQPDPKIYDEHDVTERYLFDRHVVDQFESLEEVAKLRVDCFGAMYESAFVMTSLIPTLEELLKANKELYDQLQAMAQAIEEGLADGSMGAEGQEEGRQEMIDAINGAGLGEQMAKTMGKSLEQAQEKLDEQGEAAQKFGLEKGQLQRLSFPDRQALMEKLTNREMKKFADLLGTFRLVAKAAKRDVKSDNPEEIHALTLGQDINRVSFGSLMYLADPASEDLFWHALASGELQQNQFVGPATLGRGPVVLVVDESGSMMDIVNGNTRIKWAKALAVVLLEQCRKYGRDFTYIGFSGRGQSWKIEFPRGRGEPHQIIRLVEHFWNGGTDPFDSLRNAMEIVAKYPVSNRPDVVFVTDGEFGTPGNDFLGLWNKMRQTTKAQVFGVAMQTGGRSMAPLVDTVIELTALTTNAQSMSGVLKAVNN